jgi:4-hydroxy-4-methyl-2-oxoglutarate aldolase
MGIEERIIFDIERPPEDLVKKLGKYSTATLCEAMGKSGYMSHEIKPISPNMSVVGPAVTVSCPVGDNITLHKAIEVAKKGDVLVVDAKGYKDAGGMWGEIMTLAAKVKGIAGLVIDGAVRDVAAIRKIGFPVFARAICPGGTVKETFGTINKPIVCGGVLVNPGDVIVGDDDGVVVVPKELIEVVLKRAEEREKKEEEVKKLILQGKTTMEIYGFDKLLKQKGIKA